MKRHLCYCLAATIIFTACTSPLPPEPTSQLETVTLNTVKIVAGQTVYVPVYSHVYSPDRNQRLELSVTLSIRNTDRTQRMILTTVNYYNTNGEQIRQYLTQPVELRPLASVDFVINRDDTSGGAGANFIVEWVSERQVSNPVIEALMISTAGNQGISFISDGRVIKSRATKSK
ncbi:MAG: DUF3124 domain-containing protein [Myxacorys chilensis ATA2-1-KO14]|jgi:hypothetical protein|nr:DUF3124 domain-containing protein [Myxacorys chilensis ATA2-1-KO14]